MEKGWAKRSTSLAWLRTLEIWFFFLKFLFQELKLRRKSKEERAVARGPLASQLRKGLLVLGPTFIKVGQLLSTRVDVIPKEYIDELSLLQDKVPGFPGERAKKIIADELGLEADEIFDSFDTKPIAAASLGQVHRAVFNGEQVVVKVQREGLKDLFDMDLKNLKLLAILLDKFDPKSDGTDRNWVAIYDESAKLLYQEINYELEAKNAQRFKTNFKDVEWIKVPRVYWEMSSSRVLTLEYCPGVKISDKKALEQLGVDTKLLARRSGESYLSQLLRYGFFHCDPHPGNIAVDTMYGGRLIYYDFGMMSEIDPRVKRGLVELVFGVFDGSSREVCDALEKMGVLRPNIDRISIEKIARFFLSAFRTATVMPPPPGSSKTGKQLAQEQVGSRLTTIGSDLLTLMDDEPFKFPATFTFVFRAFTTLEGVGKSLDPNYDLTQIAQPYLKELIDLKDGSAAISVVKSMQKRLGLRGEDIESVVTQPRRVAYIAETLRKMEEGDLKLRVRVLEGEQSFKRMGAVLEALGAALIASIFVNAALMLSTTASTMFMVSSATTAAAASSTNPNTVMRLTKIAKFVWIAAFLSGIKVLMSLMKLSQLDKKLQRFKG